MTVSCAVFDPDKLFYLKLLKPIKKSKKLRHRKETNNFNTIRTSL